MGRLLRLLPDSASPHESRSVDPSKIALYLWRQWRTRQDRFAELRGRGKVPSGGRSWFTNRALACPDTRRSSKPYATTISSRSVFPESMRPPKPNSVEPPWYGARMPGGVGGVASRGVPLSRSYVDSSHPMSANTGRSLTAWRTGQIDRGRVKTPRSFHTLLVLVCFRGLRSIGSRKIAKNFSL